jgi:hypothetical protein
VSDQANDLLAARRAKLERIRAQGVDPFPHDFPGVTAVADVQAPWQDLAAGEERDDVYRIAGRLAARRGQGKMAFLDIVDRSGRMQVQARADVLGEEAMAQLVEFDLGDIVGIDGSIFISGVTFGSLDGQVNSGNEDVFLTKYNSDGVKAWTQLLGTSGLDIANALTTGIDGSVYAGGFTAGASINLNAPVVVEAVFYRYNRTI